MPADSNPPSQGSVPRRRQIAQALWPLVLLLLVFAWNSAACKKKEQPGAGGRRGPHTPVEYHYPAPQPTYTFRPGAPVPTVQPE